MRGRRARRGTGQARQAEVRVDDVGGRATLGAPAQVARGAQVGADAARRARAALDVDLDAAEGPAAPRSGRGRRCPADGAAGVGQRFVTTSARIAAQTLNDRGGRPVAPPPRRLRDESSPTPPEAPPPCRTCTAPWAARTPRWPGACPPPPARGARPGDRRVRRAHAARRDDPHRRRGGERQGSGDDGIGKPRVGKLKDAIDGVGRREGPGLTSSLFARIAGGERLRRARCRARTTIDLRALPSCRPAPAAHRRLRLGRGRAHGPARAPRPAALTRTSSTSATRRGSRTAIGRPPSSRLFALADRRGGCWRGARSSSWSPATPPRPPRRRPGGAGTLETTLGVDVLGVVRPEAVQAVTTTRNGRIGLLATPATVASGSYAGAVARRRPARRPRRGPVRPTSRRSSRAGSPFDQPSWHRPPLHAPLARPRSTPSSWGCTHYPLVRPMLQRMLGPGVAIVTSGAALARQVEHALELARPGQSLAGAAAGRGRGHAGTFLRAGRTACSARAPPRAGARKRVPSARNVSGSPVQRKR